MADLFPTFRRIPPAGWLLVILAAAGICAALILPHRTPSPAARQAQLLKRAEAGNAEAQFYIALAAERAQPPDYARALHWYGQSAAQGFAKAQNNLGVLYHEGHGVPQDHSAAARWYEKAANAGLVTAQGNLGFLYEVGRGVVVDLAKARFWYGQAAAQHDREAQANFCRMHFLGFGGPIDHEQARHWCEKAAPAIAPAHAILAYLSYHGRGGPRDLIAAGGHLRAAADGGDADSRAYIERAITSCALADLPILHEAFSEKTAVECLLAAGAGSPKGLYRAALIYRNGSPAAEITPDPAKSQALQQQARDAGYTPETPDPLP